MRHYRNSTVFLLLMALLVGVTGCSNLDWKALFLAMAGQSTSSGESDEHSHAHSHEHSHEHSHSHDDAHSHGHDAGHSHALAKEVEEVSLSEQALRNIGLDGDDMTLKITPTSFQKHLSFPAIVTFFQGRTRSKVPSTVAGVITKIYHEPGVSVKPGEPLFDITLTQQEAMDGQLDLLQLLKKRQILELEIQRVGELPEGVAPQKKRELGFEKAQLDLEIEIQRNRLCVLGLSAESVDELMKNPDDTSKIVRDVTIPVPLVSHHGLVSEHNPAHIKEWILVDSLNVNVGQMVSLGEPLCTLCDLCELTVKGEAFAFDEAFLSEALKAKAPVTVVFEGQEAGTLEGLHLRSIDNHIDETNRIVSCFADIPNVIDSEQTETDGDFPTPRHYVQWRYKPGQRCEMQLVTETMENVIVLPAEAVAKQVVNTYVFAWVGKTAEGLRIWKRVPVHVLYRSRNQVVIANDGSVFPGTKVAAHGADFLLSALDALNQGGAPKADPHAGCNH